MKKNISVKLKKDSNLIRILKVLAILIIVIVVLNYAPNYKIDKTGLKIYIDGDTVSFNDDVFIEDRVLYMSIEDVDRAFNSKTYSIKELDSKHSVISITEGKILRIKEDNNTVEINDTNQKINGRLKEKNGKYYLPVSEIKAVYNITLDEYEKEIINIEQLNKEKQTAIVNKKCNLKYVDTVISKNLEKLRKGQKVTIVKKDKKWTKVQTAEGNSGYVKTNVLKDYETIREKFDINATLKMGKDSNIDTLSESDLDKDVNEIIGTYDSRRKLILKILKTAIKNDLDAVNINISGVEDKENYYRFLSELKPTLNEYYIGLIVSNNDDLDSNKLKECSNKVVE